jgi:ribonuclease E
MSKKMLVNATQHEENRVAIVEDGILTELDIEVAGHEPTKGNIYRAVVVRVESGLQAAFVDYGAERLGFLQIDEINYKAVKPDYQPAEDGRRPKITDLLQRGQELLVQITKEERGTKGAALTTYVSLAGRFMVIMPGSTTRGVSRKAENDERKELKKAMASFEMADNVGYIVRTAALNKTSEELERDYRYLIRLYESITDLNQKVKAPALLYKESNLIIRSIRDYFTTDMEEVLIDDKQVYNEARDFFKMVMPDHVKLVKLHQERRPIFSRYQIEDQIETLNRNQVPLPSGGSIVIDPTEALVAIDVNSGKMASEQGVEATATKSNIEAATEVGRQLRLRDLGGLVVIDFIDMRDRKHARQVEQALKKSLANDKARVSVGRISQFGLLEMSRQRIKAALTAGSYLTCPHCQGAGRLKSPETQAASLLRKIHASAAKGQVQRIDAKLPVEVATYLLNNKREELVDMERDHNLQVHIHGNRDFMADQLEIEITKKEKEKTKQQEFVSATTIALPAPEPKPKESDDSETQKGEETQAEPEKKRRRRRRRKPASQENGVSPEAATDVKDDKPEDAAKDVVEQPAEATKEAEKAEEATTEKKPARRRRSSSRSKKETEQPKTEVADKVDQEDKPAEETAAGSESKSADGEEKPKRRNRRKPQAKNNETVEESAKAEAPSEQTKPAEVPPAEADKDESPRPKRSRGRRRAKPAEETSQETSPATEENASSQEKQETKPKRPRRSTRKTTKSAEDATQTAVQEAKEQTPPESKPQDEARSPEQTNTEEKPKRRRSPRTQPKSEEAAQEKAPEAQKPLAEEETAKKAPAKRRPRKASVKTTAETTTDSNKEEAAKSAEEVPKPKRRRTTRKKTTEKVEAPPEES